MASVTQTAVAALGSSHEPRCQHNGVLDTQARAGSSFALHVRGQSGYDGAIGEEIFDKDAKVCPAPILAQTDC